MIKKKIVLLLTLLMILLNLYDGGYAKGIKELQKSCRGIPPKYVFYFIGDGMGLAQISAVERYLAAREGLPCQKKLNFSRLPGVGFITTYAFERYITDSAAAGTALACGKKTRVHTVAMNEKRKEKLKTIAEMAKNKGMKVGIITNVTMNHATPACFYAHQPSRRMYYEIALELVKSNFDFFAGSGIALRKEEKQGTKEEIIAEAIKNGFKYVDNKSEFNKLDKNSGRVIYVSIPGSIDKPIRYAVDCHLHDDNGISLTEVTHKAIEIFEQNPEGFFLMVEGGKIDWACHANDVTTVIHEILAFDKAVGEAIRFFEKHPEETLIVVVSDHETGGMALGFTLTQYATSFEKIQYQKISYEMFDQIVARHVEERKANAGFPDIMHVVKERFGLGDKEKGLELLKFEEEMLTAAYKASLSRNRNEEIKEMDDKEFILYGTYEPFTRTVIRIFNQKCGISWTTYAHTAVPVPVFALGTGEELFCGYFDNTDIAMNIMTIMQFH